MRRNPVHRDALLAAVLAVALGLCATKDVDALGILAIAGATAPLAWRTFAPELVLGLTAAGIFPVLATVKPMGTVALAPMVALYTVAVRRERLGAIVAALAMVPVAVTAMAVFSTHPLLSTETLQNLGYVVVALCVGRAVHEKRAHMAALQERAERETERRVAEERLRIARELHDTVAHSMVAINVQAGVAAHLADRRPHTARDALLQIKRVSGEALADLRATLGVLREDGAPAPRRPTQGFAALEELAGGVRAAGIDVDVQVRANGTPVPTAVETAGYRIVQEALTNVLRHAHAARAEVRVAVGEDAVDIEVVDDGVGAAGARVGPAVALRGAGHHAASGAGHAAGPPPGTGHGLRGMRERAAALGGDVVAGGRDGGGWQVVARLPLAVPA